MDILEAYKKGYYCTDDKIVLGIRWSIAGHTEEWKRKARQTVLLAWVKKLEDGTWEHRPVADYNTEAEARKDGYCGTYRWVVNLSEDWVLHVDYNASAKLIGTSLSSYPIPRRCRRMLSALTELSRMGVLSYKGQGQDRQVLEALRRRLKAYRRVGDHTEPIFSVSEYEHNLMLPRGIGLELIRELSASGKCLVCDNTVYVKGFDSKTALLVKVYDMLELHGVDAVKIEVTLRKDWLKQKGHEHRRRPENWLTMADIQSEAMETLKRAYGGVFKMAGHTMRMIEADTQDYRQGQGVLEFLLAHKQTHYAIVKRIEALEKSLAEVRDFVGIDRQELKRVK